MDTIKVAVIGSGLMGAGIAQACATAGFQVVNIDIAQEPLDKAKALVNKLVQKKVTKGKITQGFPSDSTSSGRPSRR